MSYILSKTTKKKRKTENPILCTKRKTEFMDIPFSRLNYFLLHI